MQTTLRKQLLYAMLGFTLGQLLIGAKPLAAQDDCKLVLEAMTKVFDIPTHAYVTMNLSGKPQTGESIYTGGLVYAKYDGKWSAGDSKAWISKGKGLPLRSDTDMEGGKSRISTRYEYGNVKPPM
jgi:hypothetical protein